MSHEISVVNGRAEAMFAYQPAWHGLGTVVDRNVRPSEALELAHLNWEVRKEALYRSNIEKIPDHVAICRTDNGQYLGTVGSGYVPVQNSLQAAYLDALCAEGVHVECAGALRGGRKTFWTVRVPKNIVVSEGDEIERYLILANSHDGSLSFRAFWSPIRVVCMNTLNAALRGQKTGVCLRHTPNIRSRMNQVRKVLGIAGEYYDALGQQLRKLQAASLDDQGFLKFTDTILPLPLGEKPSAALIKVREQIQLNWLAGRGSTLAGRTVYNAYNSVTEFTSHQSSLRGRNKQDRRFESIYLGAARNLQQAAFDAAVQMVGSN